MSTDLLLNTINVRFALRNTMRNTKYHNYDGSIPKEDITLDKEPELYAKIMELATHIVNDPSIILEDNYTMNEKKKDWESLVKKKMIENGEIVSLDSRSKLGHKILDHHMKHFYDVKNYKGVSVRSLITQEQMEVSLLANVRMHTTPYSSELRRMLIMYGGLGSVTKYRALTSKAIVQYFEAKRVLDPCIGWGGRMLGTLAAFPDTVYVGCEPDSNTAKSLRDILQDPALPATLKTRATILEATIESSLNQIKQMQPFDMILTSPPYFNLEVYTAGDQSIQTNSTWKDWVDKWLTPVILGALSTLKSTGVSCWSVKNIKTDKAYPLADVVKEIHKKAGWELVKTVKMTGSGRPGGKRIQDNKETRKSEEETFCFKRQAQLADSSASV